MPDKMIKETSTSKESSNSKDYKKMKAKNAKLEAKIAEDKAAGGDKKESVYDKKASEDKIG